MPRLLKVSPGFQWLDRPPEDELESRARPGLWGGLTTAEMTRIGEPRLFRGRIRIIFPSYSTTRFSMHCRSR